MFCKKRDLRNFAKTRKDCNFIKKETLTRVFSCKFCETSKDYFSYRTTPVAVFEELYDEIEMTAYKWIEASVKQKSVLEFSLFWGSVRSLVRCRFKSLKSFFTKTQKPYFQATLYAPLTLKQFEIDKKKFKRTPSLKNSSWLPSLLLCFLWPRRRVKFHIFFIFLCSITINLNQLKALVKSI